MNVAQVWSHGLVGATVAAWPAVSLVGSYELLAWIIRTAGTADPAHVPEADHHVPQADQASTSLRPAASRVRETGSEGSPGYSASPAAEGVHGPLPVARVVAPVRGPGPDLADLTDRVGGPVWNAPDHADRDSGSLRQANAAGPGSDINAAAAAAYRASVQEGRPLSERKLAETFGRTSRRWARNRMAEAQQSPVPA